VYLLVVVRWKYIPWVKGDWFRGRKLDLAAQRMIVINAQLDASSRYLEV
jgi:hypothetical protein